MKKSETGAGRHSAVYVRARRVRLLLMSALMAAVGMHVPAFAYGGAAKTITGTVVSDVVKVAARDIANADDYSMYLGIAITAFALLAMIGLAVAVMRYWAHSR